MTWCVGPAGKISGPTASVFGIFQRLETPSFHVRNLRIYFSTRLTSNSMPDAPFDSRLRLQAGR